MSIGWIKLHRKILDSNMYRSLNSKQRDVLIQCLLLANHKENQWNWKGEIYTCKPGQFITSLESLSRNTAKDIKVQSIRTALLVLEKWRFLTNESTKTGRLITIINWDTYQDTDDDTNKDTNKELTKSQQRANKQLTTNKNVNKVENENKYIIAFDLLWNEYPRKDGKKIALKHFKASVKTDKDLDNIKTALVNYKKHVNGREIQYIKNGSSWFNNWPDWVDWKDPAKKEDAWEKFCREEREKEMGMVK